MLHAEIATIFEPKVVTISARNTIVRKFSNFVGLYFPHITTFQPNQFGILLLLKGSFRECSFFGRDLSRTKICLEGELRSRCQEALAMVSSLRHRFRYESTGKSSFKMLKNEFLK